MRHELSAAFRVIQPWPNPRVAGISKGWHRPWVCPAVSGCGTSSPPLNSRVLCDSGMAKSPHVLVSNGWRHPWVCAAVSGCGAKSPPPMNSRVPCDSGMAKSRYCRYSHACFKRLAPPVGLCRSLRMCDSAVAKSTHCKYSYACLNRLVPPMGLRRSLRMRRELSAAYEFTRSVRFSHGIAAAQALVSNSWRRGLRMQHELSAAYGFTRSV